MEANQINRNLQEYRELYQIKDEDELRYCIIYELAIRSAKDYLIKSFKVFAIENNNIVLVEDEIRKQILDKGIDKELFKKVKKAHTNASVLDEIFYYWINVIDDELKFTYGIELATLHIDYHFFTCEFKEIYNKIVNTSTLYIEKVIHKNINSSSYFHSEYARTTKKYPTTLTSGDFAKFETTYKARYKRPFVFSTITENNQNVLIEVDINLPEKVLLSQLTKLIKNIKKDNKHIITNNQAIQIADEKNIEILDIETKGKENFIDMLIIFDYIELRKKEITLLNKDNLVKMNNEIAYIKKSTNSKNDKTERIEAIKRAYPKISQKDIKEEIAYKLKISYATVNTYNIDMRNYIIKKKYFTIINGKNR